MSERESLIDSFLSLAAWGDAQREMIAGDASNRRYFRLHRKKEAQSAVLMDAPPDRGEDVRPFITIARHLRELGLSAPDIIESDEQTGFLLLEDLGDDLFARVLAQDPALEDMLYTSATDLLMKLHTAPLPKNLQAYNPKTMADLAALAVEWYVSGIEGEASNLGKALFSAEIEPLLGMFAREADVLIQRDYHAENLLWLPKRHGLARVGLLDFQDAMAGHRAYDLVSLLQDARRDVSHRIADAMKARYIERTGVDPEAFDTAFHVLGAQRNLRILGVFARLCLRDGKAHYVDLIPRVWAHLQSDLAHPALASMRAIVADFPEPTPENLSLLKNKCATFQAPS
jgi:aminoglycoside/choline kinase family phosphotransferase